MKRIVVISFLALAACKPGARAADTTSTGLPPIDTLKPAAVTDTLAARTDSVRPAPADAKAATKTKSKGELRDSAFGPPKNLPRLDTLPTKRPPL